MRREVAILARRDGLSAIELIVAIVIFSTLASIAWLAQARLLPHYRLSTAVRQVVTDLRLARSKAISHNTRLTVAFASGGSSYEAQRCTVSGTPPTLTYTCLPYALYRRGSATSGAAEPIDLPGTVVSSTTATLTFEPRGVISSSGPTAIVFSVPNAGISRTVTINLAGLITVS